VLDKTKNYTTAVLPDIVSKRAIWNTYFDKEVKWAYNDIMFSTNGFNQIS